MASLAPQFAQHFSAQFPQLHPGDTRLVIGISGGLDSVVLAHLLQGLGFGLMLGHVNYGLRAAESDADEALVRILAGQWKLPFEVLRADSSALKQGNLQANARQIRYAFFQKLQQDLSDGRYRCFAATAHHLNDQAETILLQQLRGAGLNGLAGIKPIDPVCKIIRPLLHFTKEQLRDHANAHGLPWREDASNQSTDYRRNWVRLQLLPLMRTEFPDAEATLAANALRLQEAQHFYQIQVRKQLKSLVKADAAGQREMFIARWRNHPARHSLLWELLHPLGLSASAVDEWARILEADETPTASWQEANWTLLKDRTRMLICPVGEELASPTVIESVTDFPIRLGGRLLQLVGLKPFPGKEAVAAGNDELWLPLHSFSWPLLIRPIKTGDYFYPLGLNKKKKVARFLIDQKLNQLQKKDTLLLCAGPFVLWVMGRRSDHRFAAKHGENCLHLRWS